MTRADRILERLPTVYRPVRSPVPGEEALPQQFVSAVASLLDRLDDASLEVMRAHWFGFADRGEYAPYLAALRRLGGGPPPRRGDRDVATFAFLADLPRVAGLLGLTPFRDPPAARERVEDFRERVRRHVELYRNGLGTPAAVRRITRVLLPRDPDPNLPDSLRDRPLSIEEHVPLRFGPTTARAKGAPEDLLGPLMRFGLDNPGLSPGVVTLYVEGVAAMPDRIDATEQPTIELHSTSTARIRLAIGYDGGLAPGQTLRLEAAHGAWLGLDSGVARASGEPTADHPANPVPRGPWSPVASAPALEIRNFAVTADRRLWAATPNALHYFDGSTWTEYFGGLPSLHALAVRADDLLVATDDGLGRIPAHPDPGPATLASLGGDSAALAVLDAGDGNWWIGLAGGLSRLDAAEVLRPFVLTGDLATAVHALATDDSGILYVGTDLGLFQYQPSRDHWYWYSGRDSTEDRRDWERLLPDAAGDDRNFPAPDDVFLPAVHAVLRARNADLWIGTSRGIACYTASGRDHALAAHLRAFPDLATGRVASIAEDERGGLWFCTAQGLFHFDGLDWWQQRGAELVRLPTDPQQLRRHWRYDRRLDRWQFVDPDDGPFDWTAAPEGRRSTDEPAVHCITWTDEVRSQLGTGVGDDFVVDPGATPAPLRMRYKPSDRRIVDGGIPAVPRAPVGPSVWRYLRLEADPSAAPPPPAVTREGRLLPPPPLDEGVEEGRFVGVPVPDSSEFDDAVFAYPPAARLHVEFRARMPGSVLVRLRRLVDGERLDPAILDRLWSGIERVRPAGVRALLAVEEEIVRDSQ